MPKGTIDKYKYTSGWLKFWFIEGGTGPNDGGGETPETKKCAKPTISYKNGKLTFSCETEGAICQSTITDPDIASYSSNEVQLGVVYHISVYATKTGYNNSETVTATLCWIDVEPQTEGINNNIANTRAMAVMIQNEGGNFIVSGVNDGMQIRVYDTNGMQVGSTFSRNGLATLNTNLLPGSIAIVKIGEKSMKIILK